VKNMSLGINWLNVFSPDAQALNIMTFH